MLNMHKYKQGVSQDGITGGVHCKFNCITVNFEKMQHNI